ncbi:MAG: S8 family serine peptidase [Ignavibacteriales bacterium]|nr:MAG: S8 family serine peptidase [Ignavibacteriales bacterium]
MNRAPKFFLLFFSLIVSANTFPQTDVQKRWLSDFSSQMTNEYNLKRAEAESLAVIYNIPIRSKLADGSIIELQRFENGLPVYDMTDNINAAATISTRYVWPDGFGGFSLTGSGQTLGLWEAGGTPLFSHQEYNGRVTQLDGGGSTSDHASHVAGTMIATGINSMAKGMASLSIINSYTSNNDLGEISTAASNGLKVSNHSYGLIEGWRLDYFGDGRWAWFGDPAVSQTEDYSFGYYSSTSSAWDNFLMNAPNLLVCKSAGNDRGDGPGPNTEHWVFSGGWVLSNVTRERDGGTDGFDCVNDPKGLAKNTLTVGAVGDIVNGYSAPTDVTMSSFSGWGPTDDGRIKPDIVANGIGLTSATNTSTTAYDVLSGTSMSTPNVSGSVALLLQQQTELYGSGNPFRSSTMKALIIHTADEAGANPGPDYAFGWGLMNTYKAALLMKLDNELGATSQIREVNLIQGGSYEFQVQSNGSEPLKVTICWIDPAGTSPPVSLNPTNIMLVNDLDLRVINPNSVTIQPWILNPADPSLAATNGDNIRDNVEQIVIPNPTSGLYTIRVIHKGTLTNGSQNFSLVLSGNVVTVPDQVNLVEPLNATMDLFPDVLFKWQRSSKSMYYQLQVASDSLFNSIEFDDEVAGVYKLVENLPPLSTLFWRVRSGNSGGFGSWSEVRYFTTTLAIPNAPVLISPEDGALNQSHNQEFSWEISSSATNYRIQISNNAIFTSLVINDSTLTQNSYSASQLAEGKKLYWRVSAKNSVGTSSFSSSRNFTTKLFSPDSLSYSVDLNADVLLNWIDRSGLETKYFILRGESISNLSIIDSAGSNQTFYTDTTSVSGSTYYYAVLCKNATLQSDTSEAVMVVISSLSDNNGVPQDYILEQNYPNPFNPTTKISYALPMTSTVEISIYNVIGEKVRDYNLSLQSAGYYSFNFDASTLPSGVYFCKLNAKSEDQNNSYSQSIKMLLLK